MEREPAECVKLQTVKLGVYVKCQTKYCRNTAAKGRKHCHKCRSQLYKRNNPFGYYYNKLKQRAKERGIPFKISKKHFKNLWLKKKKKWEEKKAPDTISTWEIDRKDVTRGYVPGNLQIIHKRKNILKYWKEDRFVVEAYYKKQRQIELEEDSPF